MSAETLPYVIPDAAKVAQKSAARLYVGGLLQNYNFVVKLTSAWLRCFSL